MRIGMAVAAALLLAGCASSGPVQIGKDSFMITKQSAGGMFTTTANIKADLLREAAAFCSSSGKELQLTTTRETPAAPGRMPSAELQFMCLDSSDPDHQRTATAISYRPY